MFTEFLIERFAARGDAPAVVSPAGDCTFAELIGIRDRSLAELDGAGVGPGAVVALEGDFTPATVGMFLASIDRATILVPQRAGVRAERDRRDEIAMVEARFRVDERDIVHFERTGRAAAHPLYDELRARAHPGVVAFTSGTAGEPKAAVHDFTLLLEKFHASRAALSTLAFLLFDHLGGVRTMLHALSNGVTLVSAGDHSPETVCALIERHRIELLPATPTFLNLMLLSGAHRHHDLSSLRVISYGAEPMPQTTLDRLRAAFPTVKLQQTYGMIELGPLSTKSHPDGSLWVKVGGDGFETRVVDGILQIRSSATTLGYLNAPTPVTPDGWFVTGDAVRQDGDYLQFLGRASELINVGGKKVYPAEVEDIVLALDGIEEATVYGEPNAIVGNIVCARVKPSDPAADPRDLARLVRRHCRARLERFKVPVRVDVTGERQHGERFKKVRDR
jgi:long-chain acyl-CoA synthetase